MTEAQRILLLGKEVGTIGQQQVELIKTIQMMIRTHRMFTEYVQAQLLEIREHVGLKDATAEEIEAAGSQLPGLVGADGQSIAIPESPADGK